MCAGNSDPSMLALADKGGKFNVRRRHIAKVEQNTIRHVKVVGGLKAFFGVHWS